MEGKYESLDTTRWKRILYRSLIWLVLVVVAIFVCVADRDLSDVMRLLFMIDADRCVCMVLRGRWG